MVSWAHSWFADHTASSGDDEARLQAATADLFLVHLEGIAVLHFELHTQSCQLSRKPTLPLCTRQSYPGLGGFLLLLTLSGLSVGLTRCPSNRNRTLCGLLPWRSQKASISFFSAVVRLILKKTSLLLSVTLMFRCSDGGGACWSSAREGLPDSAMFIYLWPELYIAGCGGVGCATG